MGYHVTMRLADGRGLLRGVPALRRAARILHAQGEARGLLAFRIADTHAHVLLAASRVAAGAFARYAASALRQAIGLPVPFERARFRAVAEPRHLANALRYVFQQEDHHGASLDPAHDGSSLPDLLGLRCIAAGASARVHQLLPRLTRAPLLEWLGVHGFETTPPDPAFAPDAAAAALALPTLAGQSDDHHRARHAAVHLYGRDHTAARIAEAIGLSPRSVERLRSTPPEPGVLRAAGLQCRLRTAIHSRAKGAFA